MFLLVYHLFFVMPRIGGHIDCIYIRKLALILKTPKNLIYDSSTRKYGDTPTKSRKISKLSVYIYPRSILGYYRRRYSTSNRLFEPAFNFSKLRIGAVSSVGRAVDF